MLVGSLQRRQASERHSACLQSKSADFNVLDHCLPIENLQLVGRRCLARLLGATGRARARQWLDGCRQAAPRSLAGAFFRDWNEAAAPRPALSALCGRTPPREPRLGPFGPHCAEPRVKRALMAGLGRRTLLLASRESCVGPWAGWLSSS